MGAQNINTLIGEYYSQEKRETVSAFRLNADSTFDFFYSYGALDRFGKGKWNIENNTIILNSNKPRPDKDFSLIKSMNKSDDTIVIHIIDDNEVVKNHVVCCLINQGEKNAMITENGIARFPKQLVDSIALLLELCPDRYSIFNVKDKADNYFEFKIEPWISEVFFENFKLIIDNKKLVGKHPLLDGEKFTYIKSDF